VLDRRAIELDPVREAAYQLLMEAELARGDVLAAMRAFDRCERVVRDEFGASPSTAMLELADRARRS
jgi:DNA-binding SARP family transcriptional activator